ncbi:hypothetical protein KBZ10_27745 [Streptomyces sp. F63]|uniref:hypothetical protein n=1 Tax=Streptomyces sp. F63 TaxID=2824887 RepID=UPI001B359DA0|nr:hypothetical protein [Streptomyces sp. F63]MBQ0988235.1 hypothetical protein [Streptomyces sp. F63]
MVITASGPWQEHNPGVLMVVMLLSAVTLLSLSAYVCSRFTREAGERRSPAALCRDASLAAVALSFALYLWGCLHLFVLGRQERYVECLKAHPGGSADIDGITAGFLPLRLVCHLPDGRSYPVVVPDYVNPSLAALPAFALLSAITTALLYRRQRTGAAAPRKG